MMVRRHKTGPKPLPGPRYDCGRRKPQGDPRGNRDWQFIRAHGRRLAADPKLHTEIGRLAFDGQLTDTQVESAFLVGRIYAEFRRFKRKRAAPVSPSYLRSFGDPDGQDPEDPIELEALERSIRRAERRFTKLTDCFDALPPGPKERVRKAIERLCVESEFIAAAELEEVAPMLDWIGHKFGNAAAPPPRSIAIMGRSASRRPNPRAADRRTELDKDAWTKCTRALRPDLAPEQIEEAWRLFQGLKQAVHARARFRGEKERKA